MTYLQLKHKASGREFVMIWNPRFSTQEYRNEYKVKLIKFK